MGRFKRRKNAPQTERRPSEYKEPVYTNAHFESYYRAQRLISEQEWPEFLEALKKPLPVTFRFTGSRSYAKILAESSRSKYFPSLERIQVDGVSFPPPRPLAWYPDLLAYQYDVERKQLRKSPEFREFHSFLTSETEIGNISRQEAVSMVPPLLLDVHPHHRVLDMCAAPGSKTAQLIEQVHSNDDASGALSDGLVVANDANGQRAYMLVHQTKRLQSPCLVVTNHEAQYFPNVFDPESDQQIKFDRVLADVPCSGDGTLRKNAGIWSDWNSNQGVGLHVLQLRILMRALALTKPGGRVVYSTCSLNPIENEAVVSTALTRCGGAVELADVSSQLPELSRAPGLNTWLVPSAKTKGKLYSALDQVEQQDRSRLTRSFFPPPNVQDLHLERCIRIYPHLQNTGGFFVAVLHKIFDFKFEGKTQYGEEPEDFPVRWGSRKANEKENKTGQDLDGADEDIAAEASSPPEESVCRKHESDQEIGEEEQSKRPRLVEEPQESVPLECTVEGDEQTAVQSGERHSNRRHYEDPFIFLNAQDSEVKQIYEAYGLPNSFNAEQLVVRFDKSRHRAIYYCSASVKRFLLANNGHRLKVVNTGVRMLSRVHDTEALGTCSHRFNSEGVSLVAPLITKRVGRNISRDTLKVLLGAAEATFVRDIQHKGDAQALEAMQLGGAIVTHAYKGVDLAFSLWRGAVSVQLLINDRERLSLINRMDMEVPAHLLKADRKRKGAQASSADQPADYQRGASC